MDLYFDIPAVRVLSAEDLTYTLNTLPEKYANKLREICHNRKCKDCLLNKDCVMKKISIEKLNEVHDYYFKNVQVTEKELLDLFSRGE